MYEENRRIAEENHQDAEETAEDEEEEAKQADNAERLRGEQQEREHNNNSTLPVAPEDLGRGSKQLTHLDSDEEASEHSP